MIIQKGYLYIESRLSTTLLLNRGGSRIYFRRGCTRLLLYSNTNKPHSLQNTSCIRKQQVVSGWGGGVRTPYTLPLDPPLLNIRKYNQYDKCLHHW